MRRRLLAGVLLAGASAAGAVEQSWTEGTVTFAPAEGWSLKAGHEIRSGGLTYGEPFLRNWSLALARTLPRGTYLAASFKHEWEERALFTLRENRVTLEGGWKTELEPAWRFDLRLRAEIREFESERAPDHLRYRLRARLRRPFALGARKLTPFVWSELFSEPDSPTEVNRNRFSLGTALSLGRHAEIHIGYLRQDTKGRPTINGVRSGVDLSF